jgi:hypothetical protein
MEYAGEWDRKKQPAGDDEPRRDTLARELKVVGLNSACHLPSASLT